MKKKRNANLYVNFSYILTSSVFYRLKKLNLLTAKIKGSETKSL